MKVLPQGWLQRRSHEPELMDGPGLGDPDLQARVLADLATVNRLTRTHAPVLQYLRQAWRERPQHHVVSVLDVGCGHGDLLRAIWQLAHREERPVWLQGIDLHPDTTRAAREATPAAMGIGFTTADVFEHVPGPVDYIVSSQLAHHLDDEQLVAFVQWLDRHALAGWCIADLRRHWFPYLGFRWLARAAGWHRVVRIDGTRSIARSCTPLEWQALLRRAGVAAQVRRHAPFRLTVRTLRQGEPRSNDSPTDPAPAARDAQDPTAQRVPHNTAAPRSPRPAPGP